MTVDAPADPALEAIQQALNELYPAFTLWIDDGVGDPPGTALLAALAARGYLLAPAESVQFGDVEEE